MTHVQPWRPSILRQPTAVWAIAFACAVSFMGIGLVDPILPAISEDLQASPSQTMLLFTSYLLITAIAMFFSGFISSRLGAKRTLLAGLALIVAFAALAGASNTVDEIIGFRAGWGLGNALFISTALAAIVGAASGGSRQAVILYEAALGIGMAVGPLLGGALGEASWRGPFFGTAALMAVGLIAIAVLLRGPADRLEPVAFTAGIAALRHPALRTLAVTALFYNYAFFTLLAYTPYPLEAAAADAGLDFGAHELGLVFFGWGTALAVTSVFVAPVLTRRFGLSPVLCTMFGLLAASLAAMALGVRSVPVLIAVVIAAAAVPGRAQHGADRDRDGGDRPAPERGLVHLLGRALPRRRRRPGGLRRDRRDDGRRGALLVRRGRSGRIDPRAGQRQAHAHPSRAPARRRRDRGPAHHRGRRRLTIPGRRSLNGPDWRPSGVLNHP